MADSCCAHGAPKARRKPGVTFWGVLIFGALIAASYALPPLETFRHVTFSYLSHIWAALVLGFLLGGAIEYFVPREVVSHVLAAKKKRTVFYSVLLGFLMSVCSHGILALAIELHKKGASTPVVVSFLLASPWANVPITIILFTFFGLKALYIILGALLIALTTGLLFQILERKGMIESNPRTLVVESSFSILTDLKRRLGERQFSARQALSDVRGVWRGTVGLAGMVLGWILIGIVLSGLAATFIPPSLFERFMGKSIGGLFATLGLATILEVCSEGTSPMAFELYKQTGAFGNAFVFLMAGVVTDYTEIGLLWANIGRRTALWLPLATVPQVMLLGWAANHFF